MKRTVPSALAAALVLGGLAATPDVVLVAPCGFIWTVRHSRPGRSARCSLTRRCGRSTRTASSFAPARASSTVSRRWRRSCTRVRCRTPRRVSPPG